MDEARGKTLDAISIAALVALWAGTLVAIPGLPNVVPTSFGDGGMPQAYGSKFGLLLLPAIATFVWAIFGYSIRAKSLKINVPFTIPEDRMPLIEPFTRNALRLLSIELLLGLIAIQWAVIESAKADQLVSGFGIVINTFLMVTFALVAWLIYRIWRIANSG